MRFDISKLKDGHIYVDRSGDIILQDKSEDWYWLIHTDTPMHVEDDEEIREAASSFGPLVDIGKGDLQEVFLNLRNRAMMYATNILETDA